MRTLLLIPILLTTIAASADDGAVLYKTKTCAMCHGADGSGNTPVGKSMKARDLRSAEVQKQSDAELTAIIADGKGKMPAFGKTLNAEQVRALVKHIRTLAKQ